MLHSKWSQEEIEKAGIEALSRAEEEAAARAKTIAGLVEDLDLEEVAEDYLYEEECELRPGITHEAAVKLLAQAMAETLQDVEEAEREWRQPDPQYSDELVHNGSGYFEEAFGRHASAEYESAEDYDAKKAARQAAAAEEFAHRQQQDQELAEAVQQGILSVMQPGKAYYFSSPCWMPVVQKAGETLGITDSRVQPTRNGGAPGVVHQTLELLIHTGAITKTDDKPRKLYLAG
jgi:hypothetical protein